MALGSSFVVILAEIGLLIFVYFKNYFGWLVLLFISLAILIMVIALIRVIGNVVALTKLERAKPSVSEINLYDVIPKEFSVGASSRADT